MINTLDLKEMGLEPMTALEIEQIDGGSVRGAIRAAAGLVIDVATGFWDGLVQGFSEGAS